MTNCALMSVSIGIKCKYGCNRENPKYHACTYPLEGVGNVFLEKRVD